MAPSQSQSRSSSSSGSSGSSADSSTMPLSVEGSNSDALDSLPARRVEGKGGYVYDQFPDGNIVIVSVNGTLDGTLCRVGTTANEAITAEIGEYEAPAGSGTSTGSDSSSGQAAPPVEEPSGTEEGAGIFGAALELGEAALQGAVEGATSVFEDVQDYADDAVEAVPNAFWDLVGWGEEEGQEETFDEPVQEEAPQEDGIGVSDENVGERWIVTDSNALLRDGPPKQMPTGDKVPEGVEVEIIEQAERNGHMYSKISGVDPDSGQEREWGWTAHSNLTDASVTERAEKYASVEGGGGNTTQLAKSREGGNAYTPSDVRSEFGNLEGQEYLDAVDETIRAKTFTEDQKALLDAAREFAQSPKPLSGTAAGNASISWSNLSMDGTSVNGELIARMERMQQFAAWAGLVTSPTTRASGMRSPQKAHELSTAWMFNEGNATSSSGLNSEKNRSKLADNLVNYGGTDMDGNEWVSAANVERVEQAQGDDAAMEALLPDLRADAARVATQSAVAAEGYEDADHRRPNVKPGSYVSNHLKGLAVDVFHEWIFPNLFDPVIDSIALYFGVYRACKDLSTPEHWHYELLGTPPGPKEGEESVL